MSIMAKNKLTYYVLCFFLAVFFAGPGQAKSVVKNEITTAALFSEVSAIQAGTPFWVAIRLDTRPEWHSYWKNPGDSGMPTEISWDLPEGFKAGAIYWQPPERIPYAGMVNYGYNSSTALLIPIAPPATLAPGARHTLKVKADWLVCKDICIPESATLSMSLPTNTGEDIARSKEYELIQSYAARLPRAINGSAVYHTTQNEVTIDITFHDLPEELTFSHGEWIPERDGVIVNASEQKTAFANHMVSITAERGTAEAGGPYPGILRLITDDNRRLHFLINAEEAALMSVPLVATPEPEETPVSHTTPPENTSAMPPSSSSHSLGLFTAIMFAFLGGIILNAMPCVLPVLSLKALSLAKKADHSTRTVRLQGLAYTAGIIFSFLVIAIILILLRQAGEAIGWGFQLQSPVFVTLMIYLMFLIGLNLSGLFELPSIATNLGHEAASKNNLTGSFMTGLLATLVATPCTVPFMAGALGYAMTQPVLLSLLIFVFLGLGLAIPYLLICFVPKLQAWLPKPGAWMEHFRQLLAFPMYATAIWLVWVLVHQSGDMGLLAALIGLLVIVFTIWLIESLRYRPFLRILTLVISAVILLMTVSVQETVSAPTPHTTSDAGAVKERFSFDRLAYHREQNTPIFVNATADWCITCKVNERVALRDDTVQKAFAEKGMVTLVADWTNRDPEITDYLASFERSGVPIYVYYPPAGTPQVLPQLLTPGIILEAIGAQNE